MQQSLYHPSFLARPFKGQIQSHPKEDIGSVLKTGHAFLFFLLPRSTASDLEVLHEDEGCIIALQRAMEHLGMKISDKDLDTSHEVGPTKIKKC